MTPDFPHGRLERAGVDAKIIEGLRAQFDNSEVDDKQGFVSTLAGLGDAEVLERYGTTEPEVPVRKPRSRKPGPKAKADESADASESTPDATESGAEGDSTTEPEDAEGDKNASHGDPLEDETDQAG